MFVKYILGYVQENGTSFLDKLWHRCHFETLSKTFLVIEKKRTCKRKEMLTSVNKQTLYGKKRAHPGPVSDANDAP